MKDVNIEEFAIEKEFNVDVLKIAMNDDMPKAQPISERVIKLINSIGDKEEIVFDAPDFLFTQFCHSCCHALSEHLIYELHERVEGLEVAHMQIIESMSIHSCVELTFNGRVFYIDAGGLYTSLATILVRYGKTLEDVHVERRTGEAIVDECDNDEVRKLTELTAFWEVINMLHDEMGLECAGDFEDDALKNITNEIVPR